MVGESINHFLANFSLLNHNNIWCSVEFWQGAFNDGRLAWCGNMHPSLNLATHFSSGDNLWLVQHLNLSIPIFIE